MESLASRFMKTAGLIKEARMKKKDNSEKWVVAKSIYNNLDYEVWEILSSEEECKKYISNNIPSMYREDFFYFRKIN